MPRGMVSSYPGARSSAVAGRAQPAVGPHRFPAPRSFPEIGHPRRRRGPELGDCIAFPNQLVHISQCPNGARTYQPRAPPWVDDVLVVGRPERGKQRQANGGLVQVIYERALSAQEVVPRGPTAIRLWEAKLWRVSHRRHSRQLSESLELRNGNLGRPDAGNGANPCLPAGYIENRTISVRISIRSGEIRPACADCHGRGPWLQ